MGKVTRRSKTFLKMGIVFDACGDLKSPCGGQSIVDANTEEKIHTANKNVRQTQHEKVNSLTFEFSNKQTIELDAEMIDSLFVEVDEEEGQGMETMLNDDSTPNTTISATSTQETSSELVITPAYAVYRQISSTETEVVPSNYRLKTIETIHDPLDLAAEITAIYSTDIDSAVEEDIYDGVVNNKDENPSHFDFDKDVPIGNQEPLRKSNMFSPKKANEWKNADIDDLHDEMKEALMDLSKQATESQLNTLSGDFVNVSYDENVNINLPPNVRQSNLYRHASNQYWGKDSIEKQKEEMKKQMIHLAQLHQQQSVEVLDA